MLRVQIIVGLKGESEINNQKHQIDKMAEIIFYKSGETSWI